MRSSSKLTRTAYSTILFLALGPATLLLAQKTIENPAKPPAANAGRVIALKEVQRIGDQDGKFFFKDPWDILAGKDGCIYVQEHNQFLKFDSSGKFVKNLLRWGQGPGELNGNLSSALVEDKEIFLYSSNIHRLVRLDVHGKTIETRSFPMSYSHLLAYRKNIYFFTRWEMPDIKAYMKPGLGEIIFQLLKVDEIGKVMPTSALLPLTVSKTGHGSMSVNFLISARADERFVFINHTPEYMVKLLDLESGEIVKSFKREYKRVPYKDPEASKVNLEEVNPRYHNDICRLLMRGEKLWVVTSTFDKNKGLLVDVYDRDGRYFDNFYLPIWNIGRINPGYFAEMTIVGDSLYVLEIDEEGLITLVKYEIQGA